MNAWTWITVGLLWAAAGVIACLTVRARRHDGGWGELVTAGRRAGRPANGRWSG
jgi:hypothetical protein